MFIAHHTYLQCTTQLDRRDLNFAWGFWFFFHTWQKASLFLFTEFNKSQFSIHGTDSSANKKNNLLGEIDPLVFKADKTPSEFVGQASVKYTEVRDLKAKVSGLVYDNEGFSSLHS